MPLAIVLSLFAASDARLSAAVVRYEEARFMDAKEKLLALLDVGEVSAEDRAEALSYLAACYLALNDRGSARLQLRTLAREQPGARPSRARFAPDLIALADEVWADEERRRQAEAPPLTPPPVPPPELEPKPAAPSRGVSALPLGIGQFARGQPVQGVLWLAAEVAAFAVAIGTAAKLETLKRTDRPRTVLLEGSVYSKDRSEADALNAAATIALFVGIGLVLLNVAIGLLTAVPG